MESGDVHVFPAVIVKVTDGHAITPSAEIQARFCRDVGESAIVIVMVEARWMALARAIIGNARTVDEQNIHPPVIVVIECGGASTHGFDNVEFFLAATGEMKVNSGGLRDVDE